MNVRADKSLATWRETLVCKTKTRLPRRHAPALEGHRRCSVDSVRAIRSHPRHTGNSSLAPCYEPPAPHTLQRLLSDACLPASALLLLGRHARSTAPHRAVGDYTALDRPLALHFCKERTATCTSASRLSRLSREAAAPAAGRSPHSSRLRRHPRPQNGSGDLWPRRASTPHTATCSSAAAYPRMRPFGQQRRCRSPARLSQRRSAQYCGRGLRLLLLHKPCTPSEWKTMRRTSAPSVF